MTSKPTAYRVRNWEQFQHYKDRNPPWIKLHFALLASEDWVTLDDASRLLAVVCMLVASRNEGMVPNNPAYIQRVAYLDALPSLGPLISCGFLENPQAGASGVQADAVAVQADARPEERRAEERREETEGAAGAATAEFAFVGKIIRLNVADFNRWKEAYSNIPDLMAELTKADDYYAENPAKDGKWFFPVSKWLGKAHADAGRAPRHGHDDWSDREAEIYASLR